MGGVPGGVQWEISSQEPNSIPLDFFADILQVLTSLEEPQPAAPAAHLQVYFRKDGTYSEDFTLGMRYPAFRWTNLRLTLPEGTGESPLRVDPADEDGSDPRGFDFPRSGRL